MKNSNALAGILIGMIAGAAIGILFAPDKGTETRRRITRKGGDLAETLKDRFSNLVDSVMNKYDDMRDDFEDEAEDAGSNMSSPMNG
ncbi:MAG: YtxH domain-containing protein [Chitinophagales bacterium]|nr:YtxH domain-containing protein [Chitinophagales bacterium]